MACADTAPERADVCEVARDPEAYQDCEVVLEGRYFTDFHHGGYLANDSCPEEGVGIIGARSNVVGMRDFVGAVWSSCPEDRLYLTVVGRIELNAEDDGITYLDVAVSEFRDIRREPASDCAIASLDLYERRESQR